MAGPSIGKHPLPVVRGGFRRAGISHLFSWVLGRQISTPLRGGAKPKEEGIKQTAYRHRGQERRGGRFVRHGPFGGAENAGFDAFVTRTTAQTGQRQHRQLGIETHNSV